MRYGKLVRIINKILLKATKCEYKEHSPTSNPELVSVGIHEIMFRTQESIFYSLHSYSNDKRGSIEIIFPFDVEISLRIRGC